VEGDQGCCSKWHCAKESPPQQRMIWAEMPRVPEVNNLDLYFSVDLFSFTSPCDVKYLRCSYLLFVVDYGITKEKETNDFPNAQRACWLVNNCMSSVNLSLNYYDLKFN
jgi:hypothetical protein